MRSAVHAGAKILGDERWFGGRLPGTGVARIPDAQLVVVARDRAAEIRDIDHDAVEALGIRRVVLESGCLTGEQRLLIGRYGRAVEEIRRTILEIEFAAIVEREPTDHFRTIWRSARFVRVRRTAGSITRLNAVGIIGIEVEVGDEIPGRGSGQRCNRLVGSACADSPLDLDTLTDIRRIRPGELQHGARISYRAGS